MRGKLLSPTNSTHIYNNPPLVAPFIARGREKKKETKETREHTFGISNSYYLLLPPLLPFVSPLSRIPYNTKNLEIQMSPAATMQSHTAGMKSTCCSNCGADFHQHADAKRRIAELESQVRILSDKASAAGEPPHSPPRPI